MIDAHEEAHGYVEDDPSCEENARPPDPNAAEDERDARDEEAWFLVGENREEEGCGEGGGCSHIAQPLRNRWFAEDGENHDDVGWSKQLNEVHCEMLVAWMEAVVSEVGGIGVVEKVVQWCDDGMAHASEEGKGRAVEDCVVGDCDQSEEDAESNNSEKRAWSSSKVRTRS